MNKKPLRDFKKFVNNEIAPATEDLESLDDTSRVHVQKLVYTNLVDRFDTMVDTAILENCREECLVEAASKDLTKPITESDLVRLLLHSDNLQDTLCLKLKDGLRNSVLRERHSKKILTLFQLLQPEVNCWSLPRVNISNGEILEQITPHSTTQPYSICGYADWLYSRRNSIVHGGGTTKFLENDKKQLKKLFKCTPASTFKVKLSSVVNTITFYEAVVDILIE